MILALGLLDILSLRPRCALQVRTAISLRWPSQQFRCLVTPYTALRPFDDTLKVRGDALMTPGRCAKTLTSAVAARQCECRKPRLSMSASVLLSVRFSCVDGALTVFCNVPAMFF